ncbi:MAG: RNA-binding protein [Pseudomonadota bacterium]
MAKKLYVGNLSFNTTDETLQAKFAECGAVESAKIITDRATGRSKGFGFVEMSSDDEANDAISKMNGTDFDGRKIVVSEAKPQEKRSFGGGGGN